MIERDQYLATIQEWEYCYCKQCRAIRYSSELRAGQSGIFCVHCAGYDLEPPLWVQCPHDSATAVKCPRGGRGIQKTELGYDCEYRCIFRKPPKISVPDQQGRPF